MSRMIVVLALLCSGSALCGAARAQPDAIDDELSRTPGVHLTYYDVSGSSDQAIRNAMDKSPLRPRNGDRAVDALTTWNFSWKMWKDAHGICDPSLAEVTFTADVVLPRLVGSVPLAVARDWDRYVAKLRTHEAGHAVYARSRLGDVLAAAKSRRCEDINSAVSHVLDTIREHDRLYDIETSHGLKQGAVFPQGH